MVSLWPDEGVDRIRGAVWGQFLGDAAALGTHWIYDLKELGKACPGGVQGFEVPPRGHYHAEREPGHFTHYGEAALLLLESLAGRGAWDPVDFGGMFTLWFSSGQCGYLDHATRGALEKWRAFQKEHPGETYDFQQGGEDDQPATVTRLASLLVWSEVGGEDFTRVDSLTRFCQSSPEALGFARAHAAVLRLLLGGVRPESLLDQLPHALPVDTPALHSVLHALDQVRQAQGLGVAEATAALGNSCPLREVFPAALHAFLAAPRDFQGTVRAVLSAGGDNAARAALAGSWLGAHLGLGALPRGWQARLRHGHRLKVALETLIIKVRTAGPV